MIAARWKFPVLCAAVLLGTALLYSGNVLISHTGYDEGVYLRQAELVVSGLRPYRDFALVHPPMAIYFLALLFRLGATVAIIKIVCLGLVGVAVLLTMMLVRGLGASPAASAFSGLLLAANVHFWLYTKLIGLELPLALFLLAAAACFLLGKGWPSTAFAGAAAALAVGTKLSAFFLLAPLFAAAVIFRREDRKRLLTASLAGAIVLAAVLSDLRFPEARDLIIRSQLVRPVQPWNLRIGLVWGIFVQDPLFWMLAVAALVAPFFFRMGRFRRDLLSPAAIVLASGTLATILSVFVPRYFHDYYIFSTVPFLAAGIGLAVAALAGYPGVRRVALAAAIIIALWMGMWRGAAPSGAGVPGVVAALRGRGGTLFAENPMIVRLAGREPCSGYYFSDPYTLGLLRISADRVWEDLRLCDEVLLDRESIASEVVVIPYEVRSRLRQEGELIYRDDRYRLYRLKR